MEENTLVGFKITNFMEKEYIPTKTVRDSMVILIMVRNMVKVKLYSLMEECIMDFGNMIRKSELPLILVNRVRVLLGLGMLLQRVLFLKNQKLIDLFKFTNYF